MKTFKKVLCILLSSMLLLFAGACNQGKDPGEKQYFLSTDNRYVDLEVTTDKTNTYGEQDWVTVTATIKVKKDFGRVGGWGHLYEDYLLSIGFSETPVYEKSFCYYEHLKAQKDGYLSNNADVLISNHDYIPESEETASWRPMFRKGLTVTRTFLYCRQLSTKHKINPKGKYRLYFGILHIPHEITGEFEIFIPTDIVLNMQ